MFTKTKTALIALAIASIASAAFAQASGEELENSQYLRNPNAPVPLFAQQAHRPRALIEGRNVAVRIWPQTWAPQAPLESFGGN